MSVHLFSPALMLAGAALNAQPLPPQQGAVSPSAIQADAAAPDATATATAGTNPSECFLQSRFPADGPGTGVDWNDLDIAVLIPLCEKWIAENPGDQDARSSLARLYNKAKRYQEAIDLLQPLTESGHLRSMVNLANILRDELTVDASGKPLQDMPRALTLIQKAADARYPWALERLADAYRNGWGVERDPVKALEIDRQAVAAGSVSSMQDVGMALVDEGFQAKPQPDEAVKWLKRAGEAGHHLAYNQLALWYLNGKVIARDYRLAETYFEIARKAGNSYAARNLADLLLNPKYDRADSVRAIDLLEEAGRAGDSLSWNKLGLIFKNGSGVERDFDRAETYFAKAIAAGDVYAPGNLADVLLNSGRQPAPDKDRAFAILESAAANGNGRASEKLAGFYYEGRNVAKDYEKSRQYYEAAAREEIANANRMLGFIYLYGRGVPKDQEKGFALMSRAAQAGNDDARYQLAGLYELGNGTPKNLDMAAQWFRQVAFDNPNSHGAEYVSFLIRNERAADPAEVSDVLVRAANLGNGAALAALAWPSDGLQKLNLEVDEPTWREKLESLDDKGIFESAVQAFYNGNLAAKKSAYAYGLIENSTTLSLGDRLVAERNFLIDHALYGILFDRIIGISEMTPADREAHGIAPGWLEAFGVAMDYGSRWGTSNSPQNLPRLEKLSSMGVYGATNLLFARAANPRDKDYDLDEAFGLAEKLEGKRTTDDLLRKAQLLFRKDRSDPAIGTVLDQAMAGDRTASENAIIAYRRLHGRWTRPDYRQIAQLLEQGVAERDKLARFLKAELLWDGKGVKKDQVQSLDMLMELVTEGHGLSSARLGDHYAAGAGLPRDEQQAIMLYRRADELNTYEFGAFRLARAAVLGIGMEADLKRASHWLAIAQQRGHPDAGQWLEQCASARSLDCYRSIPDLVALPFARQKVLPVKSLRERIARIEQDKAALVTGDFRGDKYETANSNLISSYLAINEPDKLQSTFMDRITYQGSEWLKQEGSADSFFYNRTMSCYWGKAAKSLKFLGRTDEALLYAKIAVNHLQTARRKLAGLETAFQDCFLDANGDRYRYLADMLVEQGRLGEAENVLAMLKDYEHSEYVRGPVRGDTSKQNLDLNESEGAAWQQYAEALNAVREGRLSQDEARTVFAAANGRFRSDLVQLREQAAAADAEALAAGEDSDREDATRRINVALMRNLRNFDDRTAALHAVVMPDKLHWIVTTSQYQQSVTVEIAQTELRFIVAGSREAIIRDGEISSQDALKQAYVKIFEPVDKLLTKLQVDRLLVSLDGELRYLPLSALHDGSDFLVRRYAVNIIRDRSDIVRAADERPDHKIAAFGMSKSAPGFNALAGVPVELRSIVQNDSGDGFIPGTISLDEQFDRNSLISALDQEFPVIHLASHFTLAPTSPQKSVLLLGDGTTISLSDLTLDGEFNFLYAKLLTLSACQTALSGKRADGREVDSLAALAQDAGVPAVLASLWSVSDDSTARMMREFYRAWLEEGKDKTRAMQAAKLALLDDPSGDFAEPFFWSAFLVMGDGR